MRCYQRLLRTPAIWHSHNSTVQYTSMQFFENPLGFNFQHWSKWSHLTYSNLTIKQKRWKNKQTNNLIFKHLLPELGDRWRVVAYSGRPQVAYVLAQCVLYTLVCVPLILTAGPGKVRIEGLEQVVQGPSQNHNVVDVQEGNDHDGSIADTCMGIVETSTERH